MVIFSCGKCGINFQVEGEQLLQRRFQNCPNCNTPIHQEIVNSAINLIEANSNKAYASKASVVENLKVEITGKLSL